MNNIDFTLYSSDWTEINMIYRTIYFIYSKNEYCKKNLLLYL